MSTTISNAPGAGNVTLKQIARELGVSHQLVSFALNDTGTVGEETRQRIKDTAERMGYRRNGSAMAMKSGRFGSIALLLSTEEHRSNLPTRLWEGIHDELASVNMTLTMARLPDEKLSDEGVVPKILREWMVDGLLIDYTNHIPERMLELIRRHRVPAIWINSRQENDCVCPDDQEAAQRLTRHLLQLGHTRILYVDLTRAAHDANEHYSFEARIAGYCAAMQAAGLTPRVEPKAWTSFEERLPYVKELLQGTSRPTAIITYGDIEIDFIAATAFDLGLRVPHDLSLASFLPSGARYPGHVLTTCYVPDYSIGRSATQMLRQKIENPLLLLAPQNLEFVFEAGQTCTRPSMPA